jgi:hypothetical protein
MAHGSLLAPSRVQGYSACTAGSPSREELHEARYALRTAAGTTTFSGFPTDATTDAPGDTGSDGTTEPGEDVVEEPVPDGPPPCDRDGHENFYDSAEGGLDSQMLYISDSNDFGGTEPFHSLVISLFYTFGDPPAPDAPGSYELTAHDLNRNLGTCTTCVYIRADCEPGGDCHQYFFQTGGTLEIDSIGMPGDSFAGSLIDVHLQEVTIEWDTWTSTPVPGGEGWCIERYDFEREITPLP